MTSDIQLTEWYFIRHAPADKSNKGLYPIHDVEAVLPNPEALKRMSEQLPKNALWFASPLSRTKATAEVLRNDISEINFEELLVEQNFGKWQGLSFENLWKEIEGKKAHNWSYLAADTRPPEGESFNDVQKRVTLFLKHTIETEPSRPRVIVTHAGIIRAFLGLALGLNSDQALSFKIDPFSVSKILHQTGNGLGGQWQVQFLNQKVDAEIHNDHQNGIPSQ